MTKTPQQIRRFLVVGFTTVAIDFIFYNLFLKLQIELDAAKAASFIVGALFAYIANKSWTFSKRRHGKAPFWFALMYTTTLLINISVNGALIRMLPKTHLALLGAFVIATALSATLNFLAMKWIVFRKGAS